MLMMANSLFKFTKWPSSQLFDEYKGKYQPFWMRDCINKDEVVDVLNELGSIEDIIDVSCTEKEEDYNGNPIYREKVDVKLSSFIDSLVSNDKGEVHWLEETGLKLYLSQCCIYSRDDDEAEIPSLHDAFTLPSLLNLEDVTKINLWINIQTSTSTLHYDAYHNLLCVYKGSKDVLLISPRHSHLLSPICASAQSPNHSSLTTSAIIELLGTSITADYYRQTISAGDCMFIPEGWWHLVISDTCTVAANFWFDSSLLQLFKSAPHMTSHVLRSAFHELVDEAITAEDNVSMACSSSVFPSAKRVKVEPATVLYRNELTQESFNGFMHSLCSEGVSGNADNSNTSSSSCSSNGTSAGTVDNAHSSSNCSRIMQPLSASRESRCLVLVSTDIGYMIKFWLPYSTQFPQEWTSIFLSLGPQSIHTLTHYWDSLQHQPYYITEGMGFVNQQMIEAFFDAIFVPCGSENAAKVRRYMIEQTDLWNARHSERIIDRLLTGKQTKEEVKIP